MGDLWKRTLELFRHHLVLWVPCSVAGILMLALDELRKVLLRRLMIFLLTQHSVLGGSSLSGDVASAQHRAMMTMIPVSALLAFLEICLSVVALVATKELVRMVLTDLPLKAKSALATITPRFREVLLFSIKYMVVLVATVGVSMALLNFSLSDERLHNILAGKPFIPAFALAGECILAWLLLPAAIRLLRTPGAPAISADQRKIGTATAVATAAGTMILQYAIMKAEAFITIDNRWGGWALAIVNTVIINAPQVFLFIWLSVLAIQEQSCESPLTPAQEDTDSNPALGSA